MGSTPNSVRLHHFPREATRRHPSRAPREPARRPPRDARERSRSFVDPRSPPRRAFPPTAQILKRRRRSILSEVSKMEGKSPSLAAAARKKRRQSMASRRVSFAVDTALESVREFQKDENAADQAFPDPSVVAAAAAQVPPKPPAVATVASCPPPGPAPAAPSAAASPFRKGPAASAAEAAFAAAFSPAASAPAAPPPPPRRRPPSPRRLSRTEPTRRPSILSRRLASVPPTPPGASRSATSLACPSRATPADPRTSPAPISTSARPPRRARLDPRRRRRRRPPPRGTTGLAGIHVHRAPPASRDDGPGAVPRGDEGDGGGGGDDRRFGVRGEPRRGDGGGAGSLRAGG